MDQPVTHLLSMCLQFPVSLVITDVQVRPATLTLQVACDAPLAPCPLCQQLSDRVHSRYTRTVADLPCGERQVLLLMSVRKFVCRTPECARRIFTERLDEFVRSYARMTTRLVALVQVLGLVAGGEQGSRLAARLRVQSPPSTLLQRVMALPTPPCPSVRVLGVDDFAWKKRFRYGTLLVDLERHQIVDVLLDRDDRTFAQWLRQHPEVEVVSRDRATDYAKAAREAAPQAQQVADRFHLVRNLAEVLPMILAHCRAEIRRAEQDPLHEVEEALHALPTPQTWQQRTPARVEQTHQARQASRDDRFRQISALRAQGLLQREIAKRVGMSERSVRTWLKQGQAPTWKRRFRRSSLFDPYAAYVLERWQAGVREGTQLYEEIRAQGFSGTVRIVQRFLLALQADPVTSKDLPAPSAADQFSTNKAVWLFIRDPKQLTPEEQAEVDLICERSETAAQTYRLTQAFVTMLRRRQGQDFQTWVEAVEASPIPELRRFARGLLRDKAAVVAALTQSYSNGPTEAQVHKLKLVKRQMYGRAKLPLLRQRLLHAV